MNFFNSTSKHKTEKSSIALRAMESSQNNGHDFSDFLKKEKNSKKKEKWFKISQFFDQISQENNK